MTLVLEPTRVDSVSGAQNILDLVLCTDVLIVQKVQVSNQFLLSDHKSVTFDVHFCHERVSFAKTIKMWKQTKYDEIFHFLYFLHRDQNWNHQLSAWGTVEEKYMVFQNLMDTIRRT